MNVNHDPWYNWTMKTVTAGTKFKGRFNGLPCTFEATQKARRRDGVWTCTVVAYDSAVEHARRFASYCTSEFTADHILAHLVVSIEMPVAPGIDGLRRVVGQVLATVADDRYANIELVGTEEALRLARLVRLDKANVSLRAVKPQPVVG